MNISQRIVYETMPINNGSSDSTKAYISLCFTTFGIEVYVSQLVVETEVTLEQMIPYENDSNETDHDLITHTIQRYSQLHHLRGCDNLQ